MESGNTATAAGAAGAVGGIVGTGLVVGAAHVTPGGFLAELLPLIAPWVALLVSGVVLTIQDGRKKSQLRKMVAVAITTAEAELRNASIDEQCSKEHVAALQEVLESLRLLRVQIEVQFTKASYSHYSQIEREYERLLARRPEVAADVASIKEG